MVRTGATVEAGSSGEIDKLMFDWIGPIWNLLGILSVITGSVWWLQSQFNNNRLYFRTEIEKLQTTILTKLEYHEHHDDDRFSSINSELSSRINNIRNDIWEIRLRNAAIDGRKIAQSEVTKET